MAPRVEPAAHQDPEAPIPVPENGTFALTLQHYELLAQAHNFGDKPPARLEQRDDGINDPAHGEVSLSFDGEAYPLNRDGGLACQWKSRTDTPFSALEIES